METRQLKELYNELCLLEGLLLKTVNDGATCAALNDLIKERGESVVRGVQELLAAIEMAEETAVAQEMKAPVEDMSAAEEAAAMAVAAAAMPPQINDEEMNEEVAQNEPLNPVRLTPPAMPENTSADAYYTEEEEESEEEHPDMSLDVFDEEDEEGENDRSVEGKHPDLSFITINERARFRNNLFNGKNSSLTRPWSFCSRLPALRRLAATSSTTWSGIPPRMRFRPSSSTSSISVSNKPAEPCSTLFLPRLGTWPT